MELDLQVQGQKSASVSLLDYSQAIRVFRQFGLAPLYFHVHFHATSKMLLALGFASQHLDFFAHFRVRVERLTTSDDNFTIISCREGPRQPRSVERFQPPDPAGIEAVEVGSGLRRQRQAR